MACLGHCCLRFTYILDDIVEVAWDRRFVQYCVGAHIDHSEMSSSIPHPRAVRLSFVTSWMGAEIGASRPAHTPPQFCVSCATPHAWSPPDVSPMHAGGRRNRGCAARVLGPHFGPGSWAEARRVIAHGRGTLDESAAHSSGPFCGLQTRAERSGASPDLVVKAGGK